MEPPRPTVTAAELLAQKNRLMQAQSTAQPTAAGGEKILAPSTPVPAPTKAVPPPQPELVRAEPAVQREIMLLFHSLRQREVEQMDVEEIYVDDTP